MLLHRYDHVTPLGSKYHTTIELEHNVNGTQFIRITQDNELRADEPDEIVIDLDVWKELITKLI